MGKITTIENLLYAVRDHKAEGGVIILTRGCWDLLHIGHIQHLQAARKLGSVLIVSVTPDRFVGKGEGRPKFGERLRAEALASLECVDYVIIDEHETAVETIQKVKPHLYVKGVEYRDCKTPAIIAEESAVTEYGGQVEFVTGEVVYSSTQLLTGGNNGR